MAPWLQSFGSLTSLLWLFSCTDFFSWAANQSDFSQQLCSNSWKLPTRVKVLQTVQNTPQKLGVQMFPWHTEMSKLDTVSNDFIILEFPKNIWFERQFWGGNNESEVVNFYQTIQICTWIIAHSGREIALVRSSTKHFSPIAAVCFLSYLTSSAGRIYFKPVDATLSLFAQHSERKYS